MKKTIFIILFLATFCAGAKAQQGGTVALPVQQASDQADSRIIPVPQQAMSPVDTITLLISRHEYQKAIALIDNLDPDKAQPELFYLKGFALKVMSRYEDAAGWLQKAYATDTTNKTYGIELASCLDGMNDHTSAQHVLRSLQKLHPDDPFILQQLAQSCFLAENFRQAKTYYLEIYRTDSSYYFTRRLANCYDMLNSKDSAILYYRKVLMTQPDDNYAVYRIATLYKDTKRYTEGLQVTEQYLEKDTADLNINLLNGYLHYLGKDFRTAVQRFQRCEELKDTSLFVNRYLGYSLYKLQEYDQAIPYLERATIQDSMDYELNYVLGLACQYTGNSKGGIPRLKKAIELIDPVAGSLSKVYQGLARSYTLDFQYEKALETYFKAEELAPDDTLLLYMIGSHYENWLWDKNHALEYYRKFMATRPVTSSAPEPAITPDGLVLSYYDVVAKRIQDLEEQIREEELESQILPFWMAREEIDTILLILDAVHPTFTRDPNRKKLLDIRDTLYTDLTLHEYFKIIQPLVAVDGHTTIQFTGTIYPEMDNPYFPFEVVAYHDSLYVKRNLSNDGFIKPGTRIISINGKDPADIITTLLPYMPGELPFNKLRALEGNGFANFYRLVHGNFEHFDLILQYGSNSYQVSVPGVERDAFQTAATDPLNFKVLNDTIGYFKVGRFVNPPQFMAYTDSVFSVLRQRNIHHLIIDKTQGGGFGDLADSLLSYFTSYPYRSTEKKLVRISPETTDYIQEKIDQSIGKTEGDFFVMTPELQMPVNRANHYKGKVYILTGPTAYSAATLFVAMAKCYSDAIIIGEETGQPLISNGDLSRHDLRFSGFALYSSLSTYYMPCYKNDKEGVKSDIEVIMTLEDLLEDNNKYLDQTLQMIRESSPLLQAQPSQSRQ